MDETSWAATEFGEAELGDARRTARLVDLARTLAERPSASLPEACEDLAQLKAAYRFFDTEDAKPDAMLASHVTATARRIDEVELVLAVQDTTSLDYTAHPATTGLGVLNDVKHQGFLVHTTLAITPERVPLGVLAQDVWTRDAASLGKRRTRKQRPIAEKESQKWLTSLEAVKTLAARCPQTRFISVGDREADVYDFFLVTRPAGVDLLVRASWDRCVADARQPHLWAAIEAAPEVGSLTVTVPRKPGHPSRTAHLSVRFQQVALRPPRHRATEHLPFASVAAVLVREIAPPTDTPPIEWLLLTTCTVTSVKQACEMVAQMGSIRDVFFIAALFRTSMRILWEGSYWR